MTSALLAFAVTLAATWPARRLAVRYGLLDQPGPRKSHPAPVPYLGGVAVLAGAAAGVILFARGSLPVLALIAVMVALGAFDDVRHAAPLTKLVTQASVALAAVALGFSWHLTDSPALNAIVSVLWMVGLSNSFNLLDNMDGLSSTVALGALAGVGLMVPGTAGLAFPLAGAVGGFLLVNLPPARMFLGDAGSLAVGFAVAVVTIAGANSARGLHSVVLLAFPVALGLFDTSLVIVSRLRTGRPIQLGGKDHFSHRLRLLGWSDRQIVLGAAAASLVGVLIAFTAGRYPLAEAWFAVPLGLGYLGAWLRLLGVDPYSARVARPEVHSA